MSRITGPEGVVFAALSRRKSPDLTKGEEKILRQAAVAAGKAYCHQTEPYRRAAEQGLARLGLRSEVFVDWEQAWRVLSLCAGAIR